MARGCACEVVARLYHIWKVVPGVGSRIPSDHAVARGEVDVASCKQPPAVVGAGGSRRASRREISDCSIVPGVGARIVAPGFVRGGVPTACINIAAKGYCHEVVVGKWVVCSHRPGICGDGVHLDVKVGADSGACDAVDFAVEIGGGVEVGGNGIRRQARVIGIADRVVAPKGGSGVEVLIHSAKQVDISSIGCAGEPATRRRK